MIQVKKLAKSFGAKQVLRDIQLDLRKGQVYGIVGANGAGKTTLFRCMAGLEAHAGSVISEKTPLKNHLGFLPTDPYFFPKITGWEYLRLCCNARQKKITDFKKKNIFNLPLNQYAITYSTGMKKKLALTAILLQENDYFILDEPFNGVDIQSNIIITEIIHKLKALQKIVVISSHIFSTLQDTCDEIQLLKNGTFIRKVLPHEFKQLEQEMKDFTVGDSVEKLELK